MIYVAKSLTTTLKMVIGLFCNSIFGVLMTTFLVMKVLSSVLRPARSIFRAEFLGSKSQSFLLKNVSVNVKKVPRSSPENSISYAIQNFTSNAKKQKGSQ